MRVSFTATAKPAGEPVTLAEMRAQTRVDDGADDALLLGYLVAAREHIEDYLGRPIQPTPMQARLEAWPDEPALLLDAPVISVDGVTYTNSAGQVVAWTDFVVRDGPGGTKRLRPAAGASWPALGVDPVISITITAGWPAALLPDVVGTAILQTAAHWYSVREVVNIGNISSEIPEMGKKLLRGKRWRLIG